MRGRRLLQVMMATSRLVAAHAVAPRILFLTPAAAAAAAVRRSTFAPRFSTSSSSCSSTTSSHKDSSKPNCLRSGLYLVATPIGNLEDITLRALRVLKSADVILSEDTRHSGKLLQYYNIKTTLLSYHRFNESQRETMILQRLQQGHVVALISDAGTPGISDPGMELTKLCVSKNIPVIPIPGPSALVAALSASGLPTDEFTFVGFLPKHAGSRKERLAVSANESATQIFFVPPHKLLQFLDDASSIFGDTRLCVIAREMTKLHEEFWRGTLGEAKDVFSCQQPKGEITLLITGKVNSVSEFPSEQLEHELRDLISNGHSLSMAVKLVAEGTTAKRNHIYTLALRLFGNTWKLRSLRIRRPEDNPTIDAEHPHKEGRPCCQSYSSEFNSGGQLLPPALYAF